MQFSLELRRALLRNVARQEGRWTGQLDLLSFLREVFDLQRMPSRDNRFKTAYDDLWQHTVNNDDYAEDDVLSDPRFDPVVMTDQQFERFLNKALHVDTWLERDGLNRLVEIIVPVLSHGGLRLEEHFEFGAFEGYRVAEDRSGIAKAAASELKVTPSQRMELLQRSARLFRSDSRSLRSKPIWATLHFPSRPRSTMAPTANECLRTTCFRMRPQINFYQSQKT